MTDLELLLALIKEYNSELDTERIERAYRVTEAAHAGQTRSSGEPYVTHPLATAKILADLYMDERMDYSGSVSAWNKPNAAS